ncbi:hypothetical protein BDFB_002726 [Asbolus verrucosus]|uniref:Uncharacterized protein n=1 Tax=Asbolus verrucosus TaxID=1661398 RepID=A0A482W8K6_ASBVE|nr:hypothetical protein BDFB_002726 [Asbolus verrucosus]
MLVHRFGTYCQIITKTNINFDLFDKKVDEMTIDELKSRDPLKIAKDLQKLKGINNEYEDQEEESVETRKTFRNLTQVTARNSRPINSLDEAFRTRVTLIDTNKNNPTVSVFRKKSVAFARKRMSKAAARQSQARSTLQMNYPNNNETLILEDPNNDSDCDL